MKRGFTLVEFLVVIAIIDFLAIVLVLTLNPGGLLEQSHDANRIQDLGTLKTALSLYLEDTSLPKLASSTAGYAGCYLSTVSGHGTTTAKCGVFVGAGIINDVSTTATLYTDIDATGWVPVNFSQLSYGTPLTALPTDPTNNATFYYAYAASSSDIFELDAWMESAKYGKKGSSDEVQTDGGDNPNVYETGSSLTL